jgi:uncharacterized protein YegP (UPF0339 family)
MTEEPTPPRIEFFSRKRRKQPGRIYYFRIKAANGEIVVPSQGYSRKVDCIATAARLRGTLIEARMFDMDKDGEEIF